LNRSIAKGMILALEEGISRRSSQDTSQGKRPSTSDPKALIKKGEILWN